MIWQTGLWHAQLDTHTLHIYSRSSYHPTPRPYRGNVKDRASKQPESSPIWVQLKSQSPDGRHPQQIFETPKATPHGPEPQIPTHTPDRTQLRDGSPRRRQAGSAPPLARDTRKPALLAAQESPDDTSDSGGGVRKRTRTLGDPIDDPGLERLVRLGGTSVLDSNPILCSLSTELIAKNSREVQSAT